MKLIKGDKLRALVLEIFQSRSVPLEDAQIVADCLIHADLQGTDTHGVMRVAHYLRRLDQGSITPTPSMTLHRTGPATGWLDGGGGLGPVGVWRAMNAAIDLARESGVAVIGVNHSCHCGALSFYGYQAIRADMIGCAMTQTDSSVVPVDGRKPFCGTNPLCFAIPSRTGTPVVLDMATSTVSGGAILKARARNQSIPQSWGLDAGGQPTTNPHKVAYYTPAAGAKGYSLGVIVDILTGILCGGTFGPHTPAYEDCQRPRNLCHLVSAIDYHRFPGNPSFLDQVMRMAEELHAVTPMHEGGRVLAPGEPEYLRERDRRANGIPLDDDVLKELESLRSPRPKGGDGQTRL